MEGVGVVSDVVKVLLSQNFLVAALAILGWAATCIVVVVLWRAYQKQAETSAQLSNDHVQAQIKTAVAIESLKVPLETLKVLVEGSMRRR